MTDKAVLLAVFAFKPGSTLHSYLKKKKPHEGWSAFTLGALLDTIYSLIYAERRFDFRNNSLIICGHHLTNALNTPMLHKKQLKSYVLPHIYYVAPPQHLPFFKFKNTCSVSEPMNDLSQRMPMYCTLSPGLKRIFSSLATFPKHQSIFSYNTIYDTMTNYLSTHQQQLIDDRNRFIYNLKHDSLLRKVFKVKGFHRCQLPKLLKPHVFRINKL